MITSFLFFACAPEGDLSYSGADLAPVGTQYTLTTEGSSSSTYYRIVDDGEPVPASSIVGTAADCASASQVLTSRTDTSSYEVINLLQVIAHTPLNHPLIPDAEDVFSQREAMVIQDRNSSASVSLIEETRYDPTTFATYTTNTYTDEEQNFSASYFGVTADEYVVRFGLGELWSDFEEIAPSSIELLTKNDPEIGDIWVSTNGNTLYIYAGIDVLNFGSLPKEVHKVEMYEVGGLKPEGSDIWTQCLDIGASQLQSDDPNQTQYDEDEVFLHSGCVDSFTHIKTGTQWWFQNLLVKEEASTQDIQILDYGFEWYQADSTGTSCTRQTATSYSDPLFPASAYMEYVLTKSSYTTELSDWIQPQ